MASKTTVEDTGKAKPYHAKDCKPGERPCDRPQTFTYSELMGSLFKSAGVPFGAKSPEEARGVFPPLEPIDNFVEHANEAISRVFRVLRRDLSSGFTTSEGAKSVTSEDAKYEALEIMGGKFGGKLFHVQAAIADLSVSREEVARRAYECGFWVGRLPMREHESDVVRGRKTLAAGRTGRAIAHGTPAERVRFRSAVLLRWEEIRAENPNLPVIEIDALVGKQFRINKHLLSGRTVRTYRLSKK